MITKPRVMIVDDEENVREVLNMISSTFKFEVIAEISNGNEAISAFRKEKPDILFLDINMPFMYGDEVLEALKDEIENTCVIMLTAFSDVDNVKKCIKLGATYFIRKDTSVPKIASIIKETWYKFNEKHKEKSKKYNLNILIQEIKNDKLLNKYWEKDNRIG
ncbi:MAG: response regulator [Candidatus Gastranaerophilales bacterium]|nr:response regulator [Candidatus Gastranaerophilales bacterium]